MGKSHSFENENEAAAAAELNLEVLGIELEMIDVPTTTTTASSYTSLRDIMMPVPQPNSITTNGGSSWNEIPIKNPLLKQAALAYLQPMSTPTDVGTNKSFFQKCFSCGCGGASTPQSGCFFPWLFTLVEGFLGLFCDRTRRNPNEDHQRDEHHEDDDEDEEEEEDDDDEDNVE